jgi:nitrogen regulatory protein PII
LSKEGKTVKEVKAYIKQHKLDDVKLALHSVRKLTGMSVVEVRGFGRSRKSDSRSRETGEFVDYVPHVKIEIVCPDEMVEEIISVIEEKAHTGLRGDGKIYVTNVDNAVRIETGERGENAV